ncbi:MAG: hypothetical protein ACREDJ_00980 [Methylocella sp.]
MFMIESFAAAGYWRNDTRSWAISGLPFRPISRADRTKTFGNYIDKNAKQEVECPARDRPAENAEIESTHQLVEAGVAILWNSGMADGCLEADKLPVAEIYEAMARVRYQACGRPD